MERPTNDEVMAAVMTMAEVIPFFPQTGPGKDIVFSNMRDFVEHKQALDWLTAVACRVMAKFSIPELRGLYCTRYEPMDGMPANSSTIPGFTPVEAAAASKMRFIAREAEETKRKLLEWRREAQRLQITGEVEEPEAVAIATVAPGKLHEMPSAKAIPPRWLADLMARHKATDGKELDLRPLREIETELASALKIKRTAEETERIEADLREKLESLARQPNGTEAA